MARVEERERARRAAPHERSEADRHTTGQRGAWPHGGAGKISWERASPCPAQSAHLPASRHSTILSGSTAGVELE
jgi:hypothetical protein